MQTRCRREVNHRGEVLDRPKIVRHRTLDEVLDPAGHSEDTVLVEELSNLRFLGGGISYPAIRILRELKCWDIFIAFFLVGLKGNRPIPFLLSHRQNLLRRIRIEGDVFEKENVGVAPERRFFWRRWQSVLQICSKLFQRIGRVIARPTQFLFVEGGYGM